MKINKEIAEIILEGGNEEYKVIEKGKWISDGKYEYIDIVFEYDSKFYIITRSKSGSYFTDYYWDSEDQDEWECDEVEKVEVVTYKWEKVN